MRVLVLREVIFTALLGQWSMPIAFCQDLKGEIQGLVGQFKNEQADADAALYAAFSQEACQLVTATLAQASASVSGQVNSLPTEVADLFRRRIEDGAPASNPLKNQQLATQIMALVASTKAQTD